MFDLYFAGVTSDDCGVEKYLYSQYNDRPTIRKLYETLKKPVTKLFLDSGAYTAFTKNVSIDIDEYIDYVNSNIDAITVCAPVDVIPKGVEDSRIAAEQSWNNFLYMRKRIIIPGKLIAVYHQAEPIENLHKILDYSDEYGKITYMGIGALANTRDKDTRMRFIESCFYEIMKQRSDIKVHGFGMTDLSLLELFPFYSADSTTWRMAAIMGEIITKWGRIVISDRRKGDSIYAVKSEVTFDILNQYVRGFGYDLCELANDAEKRARFNIAYLMQWEKNYVCKYHSFLKAKKLF